MGNVLSSARDGGRAVTSRLWEIGDIVDLLEAWEEQSWLQKTK